MSQVAKIKALLPLVSERPWAFAEKRPARARMIADVVTTPDCELFTTLVNGADDWLALYTVAARLRARLKGKKTNVLASDRDALYKALAELEA